MINTHTHTPYIRPIRPGLYWLHTINTSRGGSAPWPIVSTTRGRRESLFFQSHEAAAEHLQAAENKLSHRKICNSKEASPPGPCAPAFAGPPAEPPWGAVFRPGMRRITTIREAAVYTAVTYRPPLCLIDLGHSPFATSCFPPPE